MYSSSDELYEEDDYSIDSIIMKLKGKFYNSRILPLASLDNRVFKGKYGNAIRSIAKGKIFNDLYISRMLNEYNSSKIIDSDLLLKVDYYTTFGNDKSVEEHVQIIDEICLKFIGVTTIDGLKELVDKIVEIDDLHHDLIELVIKIIEDIKVNFSCLAILRNENIFGDRFWFDSPGVIDLSEKLPIYYLTDYFDPREVISKINNDEQLCIPECKHMFTAKINQFLIRSSDCVHTVCDFDEAYLHYLLDGFINNNLKIDFKSSIPAFNEQFLILYLSIVGEQSITKDLIKSLRRKIDDTSFEQISYCVDILKLFKEKNKNLGSLIGRLIFMVSCQIKTSSECRQTIVDAILLIIKHRNDFIPITGFQYIEYLLRNTGITIKVEKYQKDFSNIDNVLECYHLYRNIKILDTILHLSADREVSCRLLDHNSKILRWIGLIAISKTKNAMK